MQTRSKSRLAASFDRGQTPSTTGYETAMITNIGTQATQSASLYGTSTPRSPLQSRQVFTETTPYTDRRFESVSESEDDIEDVFHHVRSNPITTDVARGIVREGARSKASVGFLVPTDLEMTTMAPPCSVSGVGVDLSPRGITTSSSGRPAMSNVSPGVMNSSMPSALQTEVLGQANMRADDDAHYFSRPSNQYNHHSREVDLDARPKAAQLDRAPMRTYVVRYEYDALAREYIKIVEESLPALHDNQQPNSVNSAMLNSQRQENLVGRSLPRTDAEQFSGLYGTPQEVGFSRSYPGVQSQPEILTPSVKQHPVHSPIIANAANVGRQVSRMSDLVRSNMNLTSLAGVGQPQWQSSYTVNNMNSGRPITTHDDGSSYVSGSMFPIHQQPPEVRNRSMGVSQIQQPLYGSTPIARVAESVIHPRIPAYERHVIPGSSVADIPARNCSVSESFVPGGRASGMQHSSPMLGPFGEPLVPSSSWASSFMEPDRKDKFKWPEFKPKQETWDHYRVKYIDGPLAANASSGKLVSALYSALPGEALDYLRAKNVPAEIHSMLWHLELLYGGIRRDTASKFAELQAMKRNKNETARAFSRRILVKAAAAAEPGEDYDLMAMRAFVENINCPILGPILREIRRYPGCNMAALIMRAEQLENDHQLNRADSKLPPASRSPVVLASCVTDEPNTVERSGDTKFKKKAKNSHVAHEELNMQAPKRQSASYPRPVSERKEGETNFIRDRTCTRCGGKGHFVRECPTPVEDGLRRVPIQESRNSDKSQKKGKKKDDAYKSTEGNSSTEGTAQPQTEAKSASSIVHRQRPDDDEPVCPSDAPNEESLDPNKDDNGDLNGFSVDADDGREFQGDATVNVGSVGKERQIRDEGWIADVRINDQLVFLAVDTGSASTMLSKDAYKRLFPHQELTNPDSGFELADGGTVGVLGEFSADTQVGGVIVQDQRIVVADIQTADGLLGKDFLSVADASVKVKRGYLHMQVNDDEILCSLRRYYPSETYIVRSITKTEIAPHSHQMLQCKVEVRGQGQVEDQTMMTQPYAIKAYGVRMPSALVKVHGTIRVPVTNFGETKWIVPENWPMCSLENVSSDLEIREIGAVGDTAVVSNVSETELLSDDLPEHLIPMYEDSVGEIKDPSEKSAIQRLLVQHAAVFVGPDGTIGCTKMAEHSIHTGEAKPIKSRSYRISAAGHETIAKEVEAMEKKGVVRPSFSPWSSPVVLVTKKNGEVRFCVDYRRLNEVTVKDSYPLPRIEDTLGALGGCCWFSTLDLASGFWQIPVREEDRCKTAFATRNGLYEFNMMPFGLCNAPATFERLMEGVLRGINWRLCLVYIDDIIVGGKDVHEAIERLGIVFERLGGANLKLKPSKCKFFRSSVTFLGHVVSEEGIRPDPAKLTAVTGRKPPTNSEEVKSFLGLVGYYRDHIQNFALMAGPLYKLMKKDKKWMWTDEEQTSFESLIEALASDPVLGHPRHDFEGWIVDCDASGIALGAVLSQVQDGKEVVIRYASKYLSEAQRRYCTTKRELLAAVWALKSFRYYLQGRPFLLRTDHSSVRWWRTMDIGVPDVVLRWLQHMATYDVKTEYRPGRSHGNADGLSRPTFHTDKCGARGCICVDCARCISKALEKHDGEPDFETCDSIPPVNSGILGAVTRAQALRNKESEEEHRPEAKGLELRPKEELFAEHETGSHCGEIGAADEETSKEGSGLDLRNTDDDVKIKHMPPIPETSAQDIEARDVVSTSTEPDLNDHCDIEAELEDDEDQFESSPEIPISEMEAKDGLDDALMALADVFNDWRSPQMIQQQNEDPDCAKVRNWKEGGQKPRPEILDAESQELRRMIATWGTLLVVDGVLCRGTNIGIQVVIPQKLRQEVFHHLHANPVQGGHLGRNRTYAKIRSRVWWPGYRADIAQWVRECPYCQMEKPGPGRGNQALLQERVGAPFERVAIDLIGPLPETDAGMKYLLVAQDYFTKWVEAIPIPNKRSATVADALVKGWVCRFGPPRLLHQDNGSEFTGSVFRQVCALLGIHQTTTTPYYPRSNGMCERVNQTLQMLLKCICVENNLDWTEMTPYALSAYRASRHESTGYSPNVMLFGRELAAPIDITYGRGVDLPGCPSQYVQWLVYALTYTHSRAREHLGEQLAKQKMYHDRRLKKREFEVGDSVLYLRPTNKKLQGSWVGPYTVKKKFESRYHYIIVKDGKDRRATAEQLRPFHTGMEKAGVPFLQPLEETFEESSDKVNEESEGFGEAVLTSDSRADTEADADSRIRQEAQDMADVALQNLKEWSNNPSRDDHPDGNDSFDEDLDETEEITAAGSRTRAGRLVRPSTRYPSSEWTSSVVNSCTVSKRRSRSKTKGRTFHCEHEGRPEKEPGRSVGKGVEVEPAELHYGDADTSCMHSYLITVTDSRGADFDAFIGQRFAEISKRETYVYRGADLDFLYGKLRHITRRVARDFPTYRIIVCLYGGICSFTTKSRERGKQQVFYQHSQEKLEAIHSGLNGIAAYCKGHGYYLVIPMIQPACLVKSRDHFLGRGTLRVSAYTTEQLEQQQKHLEEDICETNKLISSLAGNTIAIVNTQRNIQKRYSRTRKRLHSTLRCNKVVFQYDDLEDGTHPNNKLKRCLFDKISTTIGRFLLQDTMNAARSTQASANPQGKEEDNTDSKRGT